MKLIASIKAKDSSLITFISIVTANFESENCRKLIRAVRIFEDVSVFDILKFVSQFSPTSKISLWEIKTLMETFKLLTKNSF